MTARPRVYKTEGIVLRRRNMGEADSLLTVFAVREGKFDAIARGVRKSRSRMRGHLEPLTRTSMMLAQGRTFDVFTQAETVEPYLSIREHLDRAAVAIYCAELIDAFTADHVEQDDLYRLLVALFQAIDAGAALHVARHFELQLLAISGYELQVDGCAICGERLDPEDTLLSPESGGLVCRSCRGSAGAGRLVSLRAVKVLRFARSAALADFASLRVDESLAHELESALAEVIRFALEREPRARRWMDEVISMPRLRTSEAGRTVLNTEPND